MINNRINDHRVLSFTLIEILVVMFLAILLLSVGAFTMQSSSSEEKLENIAHNFQKMVYYALDMSKKSQNSIEIVFSGHKVSIDKQEATKLPKWALNKLKYNDDDFKSNFDFSESKMDPNKENKKFNLNGGVNLFYKLQNDINSEKWLKLKELTWVISSDSINEPIIFRFEINNSFCELEFGPIGANLIEKRLVVK